MSIFRKDGQKRGVIKQTAVSTVKPQHGSSHDNADQQGTYSKCILVGGFAIMTGLHHVFHITTCQWKKIEQYVYNFYSKPNNGV